EDDVGDILLHAFERGELMGGALDVHGRDGRAFQAGQQDAAQAIAHGGAEAAFERLDGEFAVFVRIDLLIGVNTMGQFQTSPTNTHNGFSGSQRTFVKAVSGLSPVPYAAEPDGRLLFQKESRI